MARKSNLNRIREVLITYITTEFVKNISEDDESNSDPDYSIVEMESDDTSTDEHISKDDSSDSNSTNDNIDIRV